MVRKSRVMIVEDEVLVAEHIRDTLHDFGYRVTAAVSTGEEAVLRAGRDLPDIILMDIALKGGMDGIEAAAIIGRNHAIPVVFLTAHTEKDTLERAKITGPYAYVTKPFEERDLINTITIALYRKKLDQELADYRIELEKKVFMQAKELTKTNKYLHSQLSKLEKTSASLTEKSNQLEDANTALRYLLRQREQDEIKMGERVRTNVNTMVLPYIKALKNTSLSESQKDYLELISSNIEELLKPFSLHLTSKQIGLTNVELKVADLVKNGKRNKEIAEILCIATKTVEFHRENIRRKLGICNQKVNLRTYLTTM